MFRDNEASRVSAVLACKAAGDLAGMLDAAVQLWLAPRERRDGDGDGDDDAAIEAWNAICDAGATDAAAARACELVRAGRAVRERAFVDVTIAIRDGDLLIDLARTVLAHELPAYPYLAAIFARLVERDLHAELVALIDEHRAALAGDPARWTLVGFILTTADLGNVDAWFRDWPPSLPMWVIAAYVASILRDRRDRLAELSQIAARAYASTVWDATACYFVPLVLCDDLLADRDAAFLARFRSTSAIGAGPPAERANPLIAYANGIQHRAPVALARELTRLVERGDRIFPQFAAMLALPRGDRGGAAICRAMRRAHLDEMAALRPVWRRIVRDRVRWWTRLRYST